MIVKRSMTLRSFKKYQPRQIAKFVKGFFNGRIFIAGLGRFRIINGKVVPYQHLRSNKQVLVTVREINQFVLELTRTRMQVNHL